MDSCDVLIVGAGPAGSSCAWGLRQAGLDSVVVDQRAFPRDKVCGGWITPAVLAALGLDPADYARARVFQPITGFRISLMGAPAVQTDYDAPISYGIRRCEFDHYLLQRCGAREFQTMPVTRLERAGDHWIVDGRIRARLVVGAGGHFCPVARFLGADARQEVAVAAQETEFEMTAGQRDGCSVLAEVPELFFCPDMKGYGWCFRKGNFLNVGLGRLDPHALPAHVSNFVRFLKRTGKITFDLPRPMLGHAYQLYERTRRNIVGDGILLVGDAAGLAYAQSGEGIRPAVESGLLAAKAIFAANGKFDRDSLNAYPRLLASRFGNPDTDWPAAMGRRLPDWLVGSAARLLMASRWFSRHVVLDHWFLHRHLPALGC